MKYSTNLKFWKKNRKYNYLLDFLKYLDCLTITAILIFQKKK